MDDGWIHIGSRRYRVVPDGSMWRILYWEGQTRHYLARNGSYSPHRKNWKYFKSKERAEFELKLIEAAEQIEREKP
jgi:hypothetical protein